VKPHCIAVPILAFLHILGVPCHAGATPPTNEPNRPSSRPANAPAANDNSNTRLASILARKRFANNTEMLDAISFLAGNASALRKHDPETFERATAKAFLMTSSTNSSERPTESWKNSPASEEVLSPIRAVLGIPSTSTTTSSHPTPCSSRWNSFYFDDHFIPSNTVLFAFALASGNEKLLARFLAETPRMPNDHIDNTWLALQYNRPDLAAKFRDALPKSTPPPLPPGRFGFRPVFMTHALEASLPALLKVFDAIEQKHNKEILRCRKYLGLMAKYDLRHPDPVATRRTGLPFALHALCWAYSPNPAGYRRWMAEISRHGNNFPLAWLYPLKHAERNGKPLNAPQNQDFLASIFKQFLDSAASGMSDYQSIFLESRTNTLLQSGLISTDSILKAYQNEAETRDIGGAIFRAIGQIHRKGGRMPEAETACREAMRRASAAGRLHLLGNITLDLAEIRAEQEHPTEAIRIAEAIPPEQRDYAFPRRLASDMRRWEKQSVSPRKRPTAD